MNARPPREPSSDMRQAAMGLHEMFVALTSEGFTEQQALVIVGYAIAANSGGNAGGGSQ